MCLGQRGTEKQVVGPERNRPLCACVCVWGGAVVEAISKAQASLSDTEPRGGSQLRE